MLNIINAIGKSRFETSSTQWASEINYDIKLHMCDDQVILIGVW